MRTRSAYNAPLRTPMKIRLSSCLLVTGALTLVACASRPAVIPSGAATSRTSSPSPQSAPTEVSSAAPSAGAGTPVAVTLADDRIRSSLTRFEIGVPYTFLIKNAGPHEACFDISAPVAVSGSFEASAAQALLAVKDIDLPAGQQTTTSLVFPESAAGTPLEFSCLMRHYYDDGMRLQITVTK